MLTGRKLVDVIKVGEFAGYEAWVEEGKSIEQMAAERLQGYFLENGKDFRVVLRKDCVEIYEKWKFLFWHVEELLARIYYNKGVGFISQIITPDFHKEAEIECGVASLYLVT